MEKNRNIWDTAGSLLGLTLISIVLLGPLEGKELFNVPFKYQSTNFGFSSVSAVTFYCAGDESIDISRIVSSIGRGKANVIVAEEKGIEGKALSSNMFIDIIVRKNAEEKAYLVMIDAYVGGNAKKAVDKHQNLFSGTISVASDVLVFSDSTQIKEVEDAISSRLQNVVDSITNSIEKKPTFFILH